MLAIGYQILLETHFSILLLDLEIDKDSTVLQSISLINWIEAD